MAPKTTLAGALARITERTPDKTALWVGDRAYSFAELDEKSRRVANGLTRLGIVKGDCVSLWLPNAPAWVIMLIALARIGAMALATNTRFRSFELADILQRSRTKAIVYWPSYGGIDFDGVLREVVPALPDLRYLIAYSEDAMVLAGTVGQSDSNGEPATVSYADLEQSSSDYAEVGLPSDPFVIYTTSGTTSRPKLVVHTQDSMIAHARDVAPAMHFDEVDAVILQMLPFCGTFGLTQAVASLLAGSALALHHRFDAALAGALIRKHRIRSAALTDEMIRRIYDETKEPVPFSGIYFYTGSRAPELVDLSQARGFKLIGLYGSSEVHALFSHRAETDPPTQRARGGGFPACADTKVRVRDMTTGVVLGHDVEGELEICNPQTVTKGYLGDPAATAQAFTEDGYFRTSDIGITHADGSFTFVSRIGDVMRLKGFLVNPLEPESCMRELPEIALACVVGVESLGRTVPVAFYTTASGMDIDREVLRAHCVARMARYKIPEHFFHISEIPLIDSANTPKVNRKLLRQKASELLLEKSVSSVE